MKVHANAPLGPKGRQTMVGRVVDDGWSPVRAGEAAGVSEKTCRKWVARYLAEGPDGLAWTVPRRRTRFRIATSDELVELIALLRRLPADDRRRDRRCVWRWRSRRSRRCCSGSAWASSVASSRPSHRTATSAAIPGELIHIDVKKLGVITEGVGHRISGKRDSQNANRRARRRGAPKGWEFVHVCVDDATRLGLRRGPRRRESHDRGRVSQASPRVLRALRHHRRAGE